MAHDSRATQYSEELAGPYREMANDTEPELEAEAWCEGLIGDTS